MRLLSHHSVTRQFRDLPSLIAVSHKHRVLWPPRRSLATGGPVFDYISDVERLDGCRPGGYHPIRLNEKLQGRYSIIEKLGHGSYSTIWLARDETLSRNVAIKIGIADYNSQEVKILDLLSARPKKGISGSLIPPILDRFELKGPNGTHPCLVTTPARCSILEALSDYDMFPLVSARSLAAQLTMAVAFVHQPGVVHGDIHIGNLLLQLPGDEFDRLSVQDLFEKYGDPEAVPVTRVDKKPITSPSVPEYVYTPAYFGIPAKDVTLSEARLILTDFGTAFLPASEIRLQSFTPRKTRPPEARFEPTTPLSYASDIWSLGCIIWEILGVRPFLDIFLPETDDITANQLDALGPLPSEWWDAWDGKGKRFIANGEPPEGREPWTFDQRFEEAIQDPRRRRQFDVMSEKEKEAFCDMIKSILKFRPGERLTAEGVLRSQWMTEWAIPDAEKSWGLR